MIEDAKREGGRVMVLGALSDQGGVDKHQTYFEDSGKDYLALQW